MRAISRQRWTEAAVVASVAIVAAIVRFATAHYSLWLDEWSSLYFASQPMSHLWGRWMVIETNPPMFYTFLKAWNVVAPPTTLGIRSLPIVASIGEVVLLCAIAWRWLNGWAALSAGLIAAISFQSVYIGELVRSYIFATDAVLASFAGLVLWAEGGRHRVHGLTVYAVSGAVACYLHTSMFLWPVIATVAIALCRPRRLLAARGALLLELVVADALIMLAAGWWIWITIEQLRYGAQTVGWLKPVTLGEYAFTLSRNILLIFDGNAGDKLAHYAVRLALVLAAVQAIRHAFSRLVLTMLLCAVVVFKAADLVHPVVKDTTVFWMSIFVVLLIAGAIGTIPLIWARIACLTALVAVIGLNLARHLPDLVIQDWRGAMAEVQADSHSALLVQASYMADAAQRACAFYQHRPACPFDVLVLDPDPPAAGGQARLSHDLAASFAPYHHLYTARNTTADPRLALCLVRATDRPTWNQPFFEGPFTAADLLPPNRAACRLRAGQPTVKRILAQ